MRQGPRYLSPSRGRATTPERSSLPSCPLICAFGPFEIRLRGANYAEQTQIFPTRIQGSQDGFVQNDGRPMCVSMTGASPGSTV